MPGPGSRAVPKPERAILNRRDELRRRTHDEEVFRAQVRQRDGYRCRCCRAAVAVQAIDPLRRAHVHHVVPRSRDKSRRLDVENAVLLCGECHGLIHAHELKFTGDKFVGLSWRGERQVQLGEGRKIR